MRFVRSLPKSFRSCARVLRSLLWGGFLEVGACFLEVGGLLCFHAFLLVLRGSKNFPAGSKKFGLGCVVRASTWLLRSLGPAS